MVNKTVIGWFFMVFFCVIHDFPPAAKEVQSEDRNTSPNALQRYKKKLWYASFSSKFHRKSLALTRKLNKKSEGRCSKTGGRREGRPLIPPVSQPHSTKAFPAKTGRREGHFEIPYKSRFFFWRFYAFYSSNSRVQLIESLFSHDSQLAFVSQGPRTLSD